MFFFVQACAVISVYIVRVLYLKLWLSGVGIEFFFVPLPSPSLGSPPGIHFCSTESVCPQYDGCYSWPSHMGAHCWVAGWYFSGGVLLGVIVVASPMAAGHPTPTCNTGVKLRVF